MYYSKWLSEHFPHDHAPLPLDEGELVDDTHLGQTDQASAHYEGGDCGAHNSKQYDRTQVLKEVTLYTHNNTYIQL